MTDHRIIPRPTPTARLISATCSLFVPGLGQLIQGRPWKGLLHFILNAVLWIVLLGWIVHIWSAIEAAIYEPSNYRAYKRYPYHNWEQQHGQREISSKG